MPEAFLHGVEVLQIDSGLRPLVAVATSVIGIVGTAPFADPLIYPLDTPVLVTSPTMGAALTKTMPANAAIGTEGSLPAALAGIYDQARPPVVVVRVDSSAVAATQLAEVVGSAAASTGVYALLAAESVTALKPKILIAPGFTHQEPAGAANPVSAALKAVAARLRAVVVVDGPNDTDADAIAKAVAEGDERVYIIDPFVKVLDRTGVIVAAPASARVAGVIARTDQEKGVWWSPSNQPINGVLGVARPVSFGLSDPNTSANLLNAAGVGTIVAPGVNGGGYRLWGNRTSAADPTWAFLAQRRMADYLYERVEKSYLWAMDRPMSAQLPSEVINSLEADLRRFKTLSALLGGRAYLDPELNDVAALKAGRIFLDFDAEPPPPLERLTIRAHREDGYYAELVEAVVRQAA